MVPHKISGLRAMWGLGLLAAIWLAFAARGNGASHALGASQDRAPAYCGDYGR